MGDIEKAILTGKSTLQLISINPGVCKACGAPAKPITIGGVQAPGFLCEKCDMEATAQIAATEKELAAAKDRAYKERTRQLFEQSNLGVKFERATFTSFQKRQGTEQALSLCRKWAEGYPPKNGKGLVIEGPTGAGKTHLAAAITHDLLDRGAEVIFQSVPDLLLRIRGTFNKNSEFTEEQIMRRLIEIEVLVLDDMGAEKMTDWAETTIYNLIDQRYRHEKPIIITTNLNLSEIGDRIGPRTMDRLAESYVNVKLKASSYRRRASDND